MTKTQTKRTYKTMSRTETRNTPNPPTGPSLPPAGDKDKVCYGISIAVLASGVVLMGGMWYSIVGTLMRAATSSPVDWWAIGGMAVLGALSFFVARFFLWLSILAPLMLAAQTRSYSAQERFCKIALKFRQFLPGAATWASNGLLQLMLSRGQTKEAIALGSSEYEYAIKKNPKDQSLAPMCAQLGIAHQMSGEHQLSILWNERAYEQFQSLLESMEKSDPKKKKLLPDKQFVDQARLQSAGICASLGTSYFNVGNYGKAKTFYTRAVDQANKLPDSPEKQQIIQVGRDQVQRLKHW